MKILRNRIKNISFNIKSNITLKLAMLAVLLSLSGADTAQAATVFSETFEGYTSFPTSSDDNSIARKNGIPKTSEGAQEDWYAARFQDGSGQNGGGTVSGVDSDLAVLQFGGGTASINRTHVGRVEDDAGLLFKLNTMNLDSIKLSFDWRTSSVSSSDRFVVGYHTGSIIDFGTDFGSAPSNACTGNGQDGCFADLRGSHPWYTTGTMTPSGDWMQLLRATSPTGGEATAWQDASFNIPDAVENKPEVWVALWMDNGNNDFAMIDNIQVTAVPEADTWAMMVAGLGLLVSFMARRRRHATVCADYI